MAEDRPRSREVSEAAAADLARAGGRDATVEIIEHDPAWAACFTAERERLAPLLGDAEIHHIGSTAVPGLAAKAVIDLMALVGDVDAPVQTLKRELAARLPDDRERYSEAKGAFVRRVVEASAVERRAGGPTDLLQPRP